MGKNCQTFETSMTDFVNSAFCPPNMGRITQLSKLPNIERLGDVFETFSFFFTKLTKNRGHICNIHVFFFPMSLLPSYEITHHSYETSQHPSYEFSAPKFSLSRSLDSSNHQNKVSLISLISLISKPSLFN